MTMLYSGIRVGQRRLGFAGGASCITSDARPGKPSRPSQPKFVRSTSRRNRDIADAGAGGTAIAPPSAIGATSLPPSGWPNADALDKDTVRIARERRLRTCSPFGGRHRLDERGRHYN